MASVIAAPAQDMTLVGKYRKAGRDFLKSQHQPCILEVPGLREPDITRARLSFMRFETEVPREMQNHWMLHVPRDPHFDEPDDGAIRKKGKDWKLFFHYRPNTEEILLREHGITLTSWQKDWFLSMNRIWHACTEAHLAFADRLDHIDPGHGLFRRALAYRHQNCLRLLSYEPRKGTIATIHTDRCAITQHIAESAPGLRTYQEDQPYDEETPRLPNVLVFSGDQFSRITKDNVPALRHSVEDTSRGKYRRFAMVFFGKMDDSEFWPK